MRVQKTVGLNLINHPASEAPFNSLRKQENADTYVEGAMIPRAGLKRANVWPGVIVHGTTMTSASASAASGPFGAGIRSIFPADARLIVQPRIDEET